MSKGTQADAELGQPSTQSGARRAAGIEVGAGEASGRYDWRGIAGIAWRQKRALFSGQVLAVFASLASIPIPLLFPVLVDELLLGKEGWALPAIRAVSPPSWHRPLLYITAVLLLTFVLRLLTLALNVLHSQQFARISQDVIYRIRRSLLGRLGRISLAEYETMGSGAVASNFITDLTTIDTFVRSTVSSFVISVLTLTGVSIVLLWMNWKLALFILLLNPVVIYFTTVLGRRIKDLKTRENSAIEAFQGSLTETLDAIQQIRASNREHHYLARLADSARLVKEHSIAYAWKSYAAGRFSFLVFLFGFDLFRAVSMLAVLFSGLTVGQMFAVYSYLWFMMGPIQELLHMQYSYFAANGALARVNRFLDLEEEPRYPHLEDPFEGQSSVGVLVEDLGFSYGAREAVLNGITLDLAAGERMALVGATGGGKSTFVQVLLGLYPASSGTIYYGGVPVSRIGWDVVRENVVTVLQQPALFNDTLRANLTLGHERSDEKIWKALEIAQLAEDAGQLPAGLETQIGRAGVRLSGGQRQRVAIARLVLAEPKVVILDEATSAVDVETEARLHDSLLEHMKGRTMIIIAHRLSALRLADRVLVFEEGRVSEQGTHKELLAQGGLYAELYGKQLA